MRFRIFLLALLFIIPLTNFAATVDTIFIYSEAMQRELPTAVVLPDSYQELDESFPVLYLLHGGSGSFRDWLTKTPDPMLLHQLADQFNLIIVTPEGSERSYYFDSPIDTTSQYETFISKEVINQVDKSYRTVKEKKGRVIAGLSMGGHGAMFIAARHPDLFCAAGSMSGVMNINPATWKVPEDFAQLRVERFADLLGQPENGPVTYPGFTAVGLTQQMKDNNLPLIFDCGVDDFLIETNRELHQKLMENGTPHDYIERPGEHNWEYWQNALPYQVLFFSKVLKSGQVLVEQE